MIVGRTQPCFPALSYDATLAEQAAALLSPRIGPEGQHADRNHTKVPPARSSDRATAPGQFTATAATFVARQWGRYVRQ
jgi:hypothetical protein